MRQDVPLLAPFSNRESHWDTLKTSLLAILEQTSLEDFINSYYSKWETRQRFSLPEAVISAAHLSEDTRIQWNVPFQLVNHTSENLVLQIAGKIYTFAACAKPFFDKIHDQAPHKLADICRELSDTLSSSQIKTLVSDLLLRGLLKVMHD